MKRSKSILLLHLLATACAGGTVQLSDTNNANKNVHENYIEEDDEAVEDAVDVERDQHAAVDKTIDLCNADDTNEKTIQQSDEPVDTDEEYPEIGLLKSAEINDELNQAFAEGTLLGGNQNRSGGLGLSGIGQGFSDGVPTHVHVRFGTIIVNRKTDEERLSVRQTITNQAQHFKACYRAISPSEKDIGKMKVSFEIDSACEVREASIEYSDFGDKDFQYCVAMTFKQIVFSQLKNCSSFSGSISVQFSL